MQCRSCGTQLPEGVAFCPVCGALTPYRVSESGVAPPATDYGSPPYGVPPQNPYKPLNPYAVPLQAPLPPPPQRPGNRIGIMVGVVLLVLLLSGGGVFAVLQYASARNVAAAASASGAVQNFTAKGTFTILSKTTTNVRQDGLNRIYSITEQEVDYGDVTGPYTVELTLMLHPDNTGDFYGTGSCTCTVAGKSGILMWSFTGTRTADDSFQGRSFDYHGAGELAKLHGQGEYQGQGLNGTYSLQLHFDA